MSVVGSLIFILHYESAIDQEYWVARLGLLVVVVDPRRGWFQVVETISMGLYGVTATLILDHKQCHFSHRVINKMVNQRLRKKLCMAAFIDTNRLILLLSCPCYR
jgi:hypothetical protein